MIDRLIDISDGALFGVCTLCALFFLKAPSDDSPKRLRRWTGILMLAISAQVVVVAISSFLNPDKLGDVGAAVTFDLLVLPFVVFVLMELTRLSQINCRIAMKHLGIPVLLTVVYLVQLLWDGLPTGLAEGRYITLLLYCIWMGGVDSTSKCKFTISFRISTLSELKNLIFLLDAC